MDTVIIKIYGPHKFKIKNWSLFLPELEGRTYNDLSLTERTSTRPYLRRFILRPKWRPEYLPSVEVFETLTKDRKDIRYFLKITFSAPKLLYWNSLQEVGENDREKLCVALKLALRSVNIDVETEAIENATVEAVHACKNVPLPKTMHMREIINELAKIDINKSFDVNEKQHKKGSRALILGFHSGTIEWSFYDKISDCLRPKSKRSDKQRIDQERAIVEFYKLQDREVFRYEYRIKKTQTTKREVNRLLGRESKTPVLFKDLFTPNLLKSLVLNSWHTIINRPENQLSLFSTPDRLSLLSHIFSEAKKLGRKPNSIDRAFASYGMATSMKDFGAKEIRGLILDTWNKDHPERITKKMDSALELMKGLTYSDDILFLGKALEKFELITLTSLQNGV